jgi:hypothetical protein
LSRGLAPGTALHGDGWHADSWLRRPALGFRANTEEQADPVLRGVGECGQADRPVTDASAQRRAGREGRLRLKVCTGNMRREEIPWK